MQRPRRLGLRFLPILAAVAAPLLLVVHLATRQSLSEAEAAARQRGLGIADLGAFTVEEYVTGVTAYVESYARQGPLLRACLARDAPVARRVLDEMVRSNGRLNRAFVADPEGVLWSDFPPDPAVAGRSFAHRDWYRGAVPGSGPYVSRAYARAAGRQEKVIAMAVPIRDGRGPLRGYLVGQVLVTRLEAALAQAAGAWGGEIVLLDRAGERVTNGGPEIPPDLAAALPAILERARAGERTQDLTLAQGRCLIAHAPVGALGGSVVTSAPRRLALAQARELALWLHLLAGAVAVVLAGAAHAALESRRRRIESGEERFRATFEQAAVGFAHTAPDGALLLVNERLCGLLGYSREELLGRTIREVVDPQHLESDAAHFARLVEGEIETYTTEKRLLRKDGRPLWCGLTLSLVRGPSRSPRYFIWVIEDIGDRKQLEEQFRQAQKMEAIGRLAGGVAHDFNNLLTAILGYCEILLGVARGGDAPEPGAAPLAGGASTPPGRTRAALEEIRKAAQRAAGLTQQLLAFSRKQILKPAVVDLNRIVSALDPMLHRLIGEDVELHAALAPGLGSTRADPGQIEQVVMNLVVNARDAMPRGGRITVETRNVDLDEEFVARRGGMRPGAYVMLAVSDTGCGMDAATLARIFEPFFTTKGEGKGTGLGLSTVFGIVKQTGGEIEVYSEPGHGSTFRIFLPRLQGEAAVPIRPPREGAAAPRGSGTILLVEDESTIRTLVRQVLSASGYTVLEASTGREALALARRHTGRIDLTLTDIVMPQMSGPAFIEALAGLHPESRVVYMSGYTDEAIVRHGILAPGTSLLQKPFTPGGLLLKVAEALAAASAPGAAGGRA